MLYISTLSCIDMSVFGMDQGDLRIFWNSPGGIGEYSGMAQRDRGIFWNGPGTQGYILEWTRGAGGYFGMDLHGHVSPAPGHLPALALALVHSRGAPSPETKFLEDKNS